MCWRVQTMVKALVVEDEEDIRNLLVEQLLDKGCQV
jgi:CheY-like chemotaxis protein